MVDELTIRVNSLPAYAGRVYDATFRRLPLALKATSYGHSFRVTLYYPNILIPHVGPDLEGLWGQRLPYHFIIKKRLMAQNKNGYDISKSLGLSFDLFWIWSWAKLRLVWGNSVSQFLRWIPFPKILLILSHNPRQQITTAFSLRTSDFFATKGAYLASSMESGSLCPRVSGTKQDKKLASSPAPPKR